MSSVLPEEKEVVTPNQAQIVLSKNGPVILNHSIKLSPEFTSSTPQILTRFSTTSSEESTISQTLQTKQTRLSRYRALGTCRFSNVSDRSSLMYSLKSLNSISENSLIGELPIIAINNNNKQQALSASAQRLTNGSFNTNISLNTLNTLSQNNLHANIDDHKDTPLSAGIGHQFNHDSADDLHAPLSPLSRTMLGQFQSEEEVKFDEYLKKTKSDTSVLSKNNTLITVGERRSTPFHEKKSSLTFSSTVSLFTDSEKRENQTLFYKLWKNSCAPSKLSISDGGRSASFFILDEDDRGDWSDTGGMQGIDEEEMHGTELSEEKVSQVSDLVARKRAWSIGYNQDENVFCV